MSHVSLLLPANLQYFSCVNTQQGPRQTMSHDVERVRAISRISEPLPKNQPLLRIGVPKTYPLSYPERFKQSSERQRVSPLFSGQRWNMLAYYCQRLTPQRSSQSQASGWLPGGEREEMGWEFQQCSSRDPGPTPWELLRVEVARQVFSTKGLRVIQTPGEVTGVQEQLYFLFAPPPRIL